MAIGDQDHGRVAMPIAAVLARAVHQAVDLALGEIASLDCQVYDAWRAAWEAYHNADHLLRSDALRQRAVAQAAAGTMHPASERSVFK